MGNATVLDSASGKGQGGAQSPMHAPSQLLHGAIATYQQKYKEERASSRNIYSSDEWKYLQHWELGRPSVEVWKYLVPPS